MDNDYGLFRKEALDTVGSDKISRAFIKVMHPKIIVIAAAVIILVFGAAVWGICKHIDGVQQGNAAAENTDDPESAAAAGNADDPESVAAAENTDDPEGSGMTD